MPIYTLPHSYAHAAVSKSNDAFYSDMPPSPTSMLPPLPPVLQEKEAKGGKEKEKKKDKKEKKKKKDKEKEREKAREKEREKEEKKREKEREKEKREKEKEKAKERIRLEKVSDSCG